jgi:dTDP-glucose 4,6-dehydratase
MRKALVTGAAGFLGSHLCDKLLANDIAVIGMDNLITGSMSNIAHLEGNPNFRFVHHDVCEFIDIRKSWITSFILRLLQVQ